MLQLQMNESKVCMYKEVECDSDARKKDNERIECTRLVCNGWIGDFAPRLPRHLGSLEGLLCCRI